ncbi:MAG: hypothetical protein H6659_13970 [Ardenticatenaceae bacterium]|nr:hypothetical protein [Ardenticatenaceae bacterium]MCB8987812.1 hypothetical protein [Ardenticatenaceae bacterium]
MGQNNETAVQFKPLGLVQRIAFIVGVVAALLTILGFFIDPLEFFRGYLLGYVIWIGVALGCLALLMMHYLTSGPWGFVLRRFLEAAVWTLPLLALFFIPLLFGLPELYPWARPSLVAQDALLQHKQPYLNVPFFMVRTAVYLLIWSGMSWLLLRWSRRQDSSDSWDLRDKARRLSAPGLIIYLFTASFAAIDWMMSLEPRWFSSIYGVMVIAGQVLAALALATGASLWLRRTSPLDELATPGLFYDLGNLLLGFLLFWIYLTFIQYLVIWSGNLPEEITWVIRREQDGWLWVSLIVVLLGFAVPFALLVGSGFEPRTHILRIVTPLIFVTQIVNVYWLVVPAFYPDGWHIHWLQLTAPLALGGLWLGAALHYLRQHPLLPQQDPRLKEIFAERERSTASP